MQTHNATPRGTCPTICACTANNGTASYLPLQVPHTLDAVRVGQWFANRLVDTARYSSHKPASPEQELADLIYSTPPVFSARFETMVRMALLLCEAMQLAAKPLPSSQGCTRLVGTMSSHARIPACSTNHNSVHPKKPQPQATFYTQFLLFRLRHPLPHASTHPIKAEDNYDGPYMTYYFDSKTKPPGRAFALV